MVLKVQDTIINKHRLNQKTNKLIEKLLELIQNNKNQQNNDKINEVISKLEICTKSLHSQFLDDLVYTFKFLLYYKGDEK